MERGPRKVNTKIAVHYVPGKHREKFSRFIHERIDLSVVLHGFLRFSVCFFFAPSIAGSGHSKSRVLDNTDHHRSGSSQQSETI